MAPMIVPMFLPVLAGLLARGAAILGRFAPGIGRAISGAGKSIGGGAGRTIRQAGVAMRRGERVAGGGMRRTVQAGMGSSGRRRRRITPAGQAGSRRGRNQRRAPVTFSQAFRRTARQGMRQAAQRSQARAQAPQFIERIMSPNSPIGRIVQNFGSAKFNFRQGNNAAGAMDVAKIGGDVAKPFLAAAVALATFPKIMKELSASVIESRRALGELNAMYSVAAGRLDIGRFGRNVRLANATSGSFQNLTRAQNKLEEKLLPYQIATSNALLKLVTVGVNAANVLVSIGEGVAKVTGWAAIMEAVGRWVGLNGGGGNVNQPLAQLGIALGNGQFNQRQRPPMPPVVNQPPAGRGQI